MNKLYLCPVHKRILLIDHERGGIRRLEIEKRHGCCAYWSVYIFEGTKLTLIINQSKDDSRVLHN